MTAVADPEKEQRRAANPAASVWVGASAGTGKTKVLTDRVISLLLQGTPAHRLLCLTFTKAAAAEMANRIAERLGHWATAEDAALEADLTRLLDREPDPDTTTRARRLFAQVLDAPDGMKFLTIHAFCQSLLRRFPLEAGIAPHFQVMDERDASELMRAAVEEVLSRAREGADSELGLALAEVTAKVNESSFPDLLADLASARGRMRRMIERQGGLDGAVAALRQRLGLAEGETPDSVLAAACHDSAFDAAACRAAVEALRQGSKTDTERAAIIAAWLADPPARATSLLAYAKAYHTDKGDIRKTLCTKTVLKAAPETEAALSLEAERLLRVMARWRSACVLSATAALLRLGEALLSAYERHKNARALLDYDDLILTTLKLL
ncbi:MAG: UvrD-helicase domain-containing protein, partial [Rhodospirillales bacterium]|nr:UvrD-helicase domain-containing protein [Rhodospirillales bacterium]